MSYDEEAAQRVRDVLRGEAGVVEKKMFGGLCFMVKGNMCCGLTSTAFMVRVGADHYHEALARPHARPMTFTGRPMAGMVYVAPPGYRTEAMLTRWVRRGLDYVATLPEKKAAPRRSRAKKASLLR